jgi:hypothetical protein
MLLEIMIISKFVSKLIDTVDPVYSERVCAAKSAAKSVH